MKLSRHDFGTVIALLIQDSNREDIEQQYFSFYNHQGTNGELHWITDTSAYFWTTPKNLWYALIESSLFKLLSVEYGRSKGKKGGLRPEAIKMAEIRLQEIEFEPFLDSSEVNPDVLPYKLGCLNFEKPNLDTMRLE